MRTAYKRKYKSKYKAKYKSKRKSMSLPKQLLRLSEPKFFPTQVLQLMTHNTYYQISPTQGVVPGNTASTRVGDSVYLQSLNINGFFESSSVANQTDKFRCIVFWHTTQLPASTLTPNVVTGTQVFFPNTFNLVPNGIINPKATSVLADFVIDINQQITGAKDIKSFNFVVPLNQTFNYGVAGGPYGKTKSLYVTFVSMTPGGSNGVSATGAINAAIVLKYKDP